MQTKWIIAVIAALGLGGLAFFLKTHPRHHKAMAGKGRFDVAEMKTYQQFADEMIRAAAAGDRDKLRQNVSPITMDQSGPQHVEDYLKTKVFPYFSDFDHLTDRLEAGTNRDDAGNTFYEFFRSFQTKTGETKNYSITVVSEGKRLYLGTIIPDATYTVNTSSADESAH